jgi:hypothetical protein
MILEFLEGRLDLHAQDMDSRSRSRSRNSNSNGNSNREVECRTMDVECGMWNVECGMWNVECGMWNGEWPLVRRWIVESGARREAAKTAPPELDIRPIPNLTFAQL